MEESERQRLEQFDSCNNLTSEETRKRLSFFRRNLTNKSDEFVDYNTGVLRDVLNHLSQALGVNMETIVAVCEMFDGEINIETLRNILLKQNISDQLAKAKGGKK